MKPHHKKKRDLRKRLFSFSFKLFSNGCQISFSFKFFLFFFNTSFEDGFWGVRGLGFEWLLGFKWFGRFEQREVGLGRGGGAGVAVGWVRRLAGLWAGVGCRDFWVLGVIGKWGNDGRSGLFTSL